MMSLYILFLIAINQYLNRLCFDFNNVYLWYHFKAIATLGQAIVMIKWLREIIRMHSRTVNTAVEQMSIPNTNYSVSILHDSYTLTHHIVNVWTKLSIMWR